MTKWNETQEADEFIASADSRETSLEIMQAIAFFAHDQKEAVALWNGDGFGTVCHVSDLWERVTGNGARNATDYQWGAAGSDWWPQIKKD